MLHTPSLSVSLGQATSAGPKNTNDDFFGALLPDGADRQIKGCVMALADGISTSDVGRVASETCVKSFLTDYMAAPDSWTVKTAGTKVISAANAWLHAQTRHAGEYDASYGYTCTLSAMVLKGRACHIFHVGDSRVWRLAGASLEPLTTDHHAVLEGAQTVLSRAMGAARAVEVDYRVVPLRVGDIFLMSTDGLHEIWKASDVAQIVQNAADLDQAAQQIIDAAQPHATDNLTLQIIRIEDLPLQDAVDLKHRSMTLPRAKDFVPGDVIDGLTILRDIHVTHRSRIYLAKRGNDRFALKVPSSEMQEDTQALQRFVTEEWIARRISNPHVVSAPKLGADRSALYTLTTYVEGQTLRQWMTDHPAPSLQQVRDIVGQIIKGLRAFHRREMLHQDLRPENIMIDGDGHVTLIDFGSAYVSGVQETGPLDQAADILGPEILGTVQYTAPEYFSGDPVSWKSDMFSLAVIAYEMMTGQLPFGAEVAKVRTPKDRHALTYRKAGDSVPGWLDHCLQTATHPDPAKRPDTLSEFEADLKRPSLQYQRKGRGPLIERHPIQFWQTISAILALIIALLVLN
ncbi:MAG: bifunctional protein-serine/threonine kinase/phosphatase [Pseudomonadota bacterium]